MDNEAELKRLADIFCTACDSRDMELLKSIFTEDAETGSWPEDKESAKLKGADKIAETYLPILNQFDTLYHFSGQQTVEIDGDQATGIAYAIVLMIGKENGKTVRHQNYAIYHDKYVKQNQRWLIQNRGIQFVQMDTMEKTNY